MSEPTWRCGHPRTSENTRISNWQGKDRSQCRQCHREHQRRSIAQKRAAMTPEERAERRREWDARYRETHREERRAADRARYKTPAA